MPSPSFLILFAYLPRLVGATQFPFGFLESPATIELKRLRKRGDLTQVSLDKLWVFQRWWMHDSGEIDWSGSVTQQSTKSRLTQQQILKLKRVQSLARRLPRRTNPIECNAIQKWMVDSNGGGGERKHNNQLEPKELKHCRHHERTIFKMEICGDSPNPNQNGQTKQYALNNHPGAVAMTNPSDASSVPSLLGSELSVNWEKALVCINWEKDCLIGEFLEKWSL